MTEALDKKALDKKALDKRLLDTGEALPFAALQAAEEGFYIKEAEKGPAASPPPARAEETARIKPQTRYEASAPADAMAPFPTSGDEFARA